MEFGEERNKKGDGRGGEGGVKLFRSSMKNREGGGCSVSTSSMSSFDFICYNQAGVGEPKLEQ